MNDGVPNLDRHDQVLVGLAMNLQTTAMVQLGKLADPVSGEVARDLEAARFSIDLLEALKVKTLGNLAAEFSAHLERTVMDLQLNYADEIKRDDSEPASDPTEAEGDEG